MFGGLSSSKHISQYISIRNSLFRHVTCVQVWLNARQHNNNTNPTCNSLRKFRLLRYGSSHARMVHVLSPPSHDCSDCAEIEPFEENTDLSLQSLHSFLLKNMIRSWRWVKSSFIYLDFSCVRVVPKFLWVFNYIKF